MILVFWVVFVALEPHVAQASLKFTYRLRVYYLKWQILLPLPPKCAAYRVLRFRHKPSGVLGKHFFQLNSSSCCLRDSISLCSSGWPWTHCNYPTPTFWVLQITIIGCHTWLHLPLSNDWLANAKIVLVHAHEPGAPSSTALTLTSTKRGLHQLLSYFISSSKQFSLCAVVLKFSLVALYLLGYKYGPVAKSTWCSLGRTQEAYNYI